MSDVNVLVVFSSRYGDTERVALAAGLGAIEAEADIRLRRVEEAADPAALAADRLRADVLARMTRDYVAPRPVDPIWAHVVILAAPADRTSDVCAYLAALPGLGPMAGKIAALVAVEAGRPCGGSGLDRLASAAAAAGLAVVAFDPADGGDEPARRFGHRVVQAARQAAARG